MFCERASRKFTRATMKTFLFALFVEMYLIGFSTGLPTGLYDVPPSRNDSALSKSQKMCFEYSKWAHLQITFGSKKFSKRLGGEIEQCGISNTSTQSGKAEIGEVPHMALISYEKNGEMNYICSGSLISNEYIITAAYCTSEIAENSSRPYYIRLGGLHLRNVAGDPDIQVLKVAEAILHPQYIVGEVYNDMALLRLEEIAKLSWHVRPICLYTGEHVKKFPLVAAGWGRNPPNKTRDEILHKVKLLETPYEVCKVPYDVKRQFGKAIKRGIDNETMVCATHPLGHDSLCHGDGGGPLYTRSTEPFCSYQLVGILGFGGVCKTIQDVPTVFTRIAPYISWIETIVWQ